MSAAFRLRIDEVRGTVPAERLGVWVPGGGWEPPRGFLEMDVPDVPFPDVNDLASSPMHHRWIAARDPTARLGPGVARNHPAGLSWRPTGAQLASSRRYPQGVYDHAVTIDSAAPIHGYVPDKDALLRRLARIEGQVRGLARMIEDERYCIDILTQLAAVGNALDAVGMKVLDDHIGRCVARALSAGDRAEAEVKTQEVRAAVRRFARTGGR